MMIPNLRKVSDKEGADTETRDSRIDLKNLSAGIQAMSENMATADITSVAMLESLEAGKPLDMEGIRILARELEEIYEIASDLLDITDEYVPPEE